MLRPSGYGPLAFAFTLSEISARPPYPVIANIAHHATRLLSGYPAFCTPSQLGRMDRFGVYDFDRGQWGGNVCYAENAGESKSEEEKDCGESRDEWGQLLRETECCQGRFTTSTRSAAYSANGQRCTRLG